MKTADDVRAFVLARFTEPLRARDMTPEELTLDDVQDFIKEKEVENADMHDGESKLVTLVMIQRTSPYEQMVNVMDELQLGAIDRFSITVLEQDKYEEVFGS